MNAFQPVRLGGAKLPDFIRDMISAPPRAGEGVNLYLYRLARVLHPYRQSADICSLLRSLTEGCGRDVTESEIRRAVENSRGAAWQPGVPRSSTKRHAWPKLDIERRQSLVKEQAGFGLVDLWELSPVRLDRAHSQAEEIIDTCFSKDDILCCGMSVGNFSSLPREVWKGRLKSLQFIVPSPMSARFGCTADGRRSARTLKNTGPRHFLVIEQDGGSVDEQAAILRSLAASAPLALVVHSGGKSLHGWFWCKGQPRPTLLRFMHNAVAVGADPATWTKCQMVRMPDGLRDNRNRQTVYFFNPEVLS